MAFRSDRIVEAISSIPRQILNELPEKLNNSLAGIRTAIETTLTAAQNSRDSAAAAHARADAIHSELQGLRMDTQRLQVSAPASSDRQILAEIANLRATVEGWRADVAEARAATQEREAPQPETPQPVVQKTDQEPDRKPDPDDFDELLALAAGIAYAEISCHRDTWDFLVAQSSRGQHFRLPGAIREDDCLIDADISGRTLIAVLDALWRTRRDPDTEPGTRHLAATIYDRIGNALHKVATDGTPGAPHSRVNSDGPPVTRIVIDDRPAADARD